MKCCSQKFQDGRIAPCDNEGEWHHPRYAGLVCGYCKNLIAPTLPDGWSKDYGPPSEEFLRELTWRARKTGWIYDYNDLHDFIADLWRAAGLPVPDLTPVPDEEAQPP